MKTTPQHLLGFLFVAASAAALWVACGSAASAEQQDRGINLGRFKIDVPSGWVRKTPRSRILAYEFGIPKAKDDDRDGRATVMSAGGTIEQNIDRWYGQFKQPDGSSTKDRAKVEKKSIAGQEVWLVNISGTYVDKPAPVLPGVDREKYRMLAAIVATDEANFYVKFYGPRKTVTDHENAFREMIEGLKRR